MNTNIAQVQENVVPLAIVQPKPKQRKQRFNVTEFRNSSGTVSYRVSGYRIGGGQVRENFADLNAAKCRQVELEIESMKQPAETMIRATKMTDEQVRLAELAYVRLGEDWQRIVDAVDHFIKTGAKNLPTETPRIDEAVTEYLKWLATSSLRDTTKQHWAVRMNVFRNSVKNVRVAEITPDFIEDFLASRQVSAFGKYTDKLAISRFFSWCIERPRRWAVSNPCREVRVDLGERKPPSVLSLAECKAILSSAESHKDGVLAPYVAVCIFGGLRPTEAARLDWTQVNLGDGEILLAQHQTKTKKSRVIKICQTLAAWLKAHKGKPFYPANWRKEFEAVKSKAGLKDWTPDVMRHTAISHYFRKTGSYGFTAEQFGNSEAIIKNHYQGRVSSEDTKAFYQLMPAKRDAI